MIHAYIRPEYGGAFLFSHMVVHFFRIYLVHFYFFPCSKCLPGRTYNQADVPDWAMQRLEFNVFMT